MFSSTFKNEVVNLLNSVIETLAAIQATLATNTKTLKTLITNQETMMAGIDDLNTAVAALEAEEVQIVADFATLLAQNSGDSDAAVEALAQRIVVVNAALAAGDPVPPIAPPAPPQS